ncbi:MAG: exopolyphosphatase [Planctomycetota bacterium]
MVAKASDAGLQVVDRIKERVFLASGLDHKNRLSEDALERALACLQVFGQRVDGIAKKRVRVVGTNTFRTTKQPSDLLAQAEAALGHRVEVLSGEEEARLIYRGVRYDLGPEEHLLDCDIGGGSTELVCGAPGKHAPHRAESLSMGSSSWSRQYFEDGKISSKRFRKAILAARHELEPVRQAFQGHQEGRVVASSGTALSLANILRRNDFDDDGLSLRGLHALREDLLRFEKLEALQLHGLKEGRRPTFLGGLAVLIGVMESLEVERMETSEAALREGLLVDLLGRLLHEDARDTTVRAMQERHDVDRSQAKRVAQAASILGEVLTDVWDLGIDDLKLLDWASKLHEVGLAVRHTGYHRHGAYLVRNSDLPGFSRTEANLLAFLIENHRHRFRPSELEDLARSDRKRGLQLTLLLRLAAHIHRTRNATKIPAEVSVDGKAVRLDFPEDWLDAHPLTVLDLEREVAIWKDLDLELRF